MRLCYRFCPILHFSRFSKLELFKKKLEETEMGQRNCYKLGEHRVWNVTRGRNFQKRGAKTAWMKLNFSPLKRGERFQWIFVRGTQIVEGLRRAAW